MAEKTVQVKLVRSLIGNKKDQIATKIRKINHLVEVVNEA